MEQELSNELFICGGCNAKIGPGVLGKVPCLLLRRESPLRFHPEFDPLQWRWLLGFVRACNQAASDLTATHQQLLKQKMQDPEAYLEALRETLALPDDPAG